MSTQTAHVATARRSSRRVGRQIGNVVFAVLITGMAAVWFVSFRPQALGGPVGYVLTLGVSMEPTYRTGDLVLVRPAPAYEVGDVVAYRVPDDDIGAGVVLIHRIIGGSGAEGYELQGDNNPTPDEWHPRDTDVVGKAWLVLPRAGSVLAKARDPLVLASLAAGIAAAMVLRPSRKPAEAS